MQNNQNNRPLEKFRVGAISATVWLNNVQTKKGPIKMFKVDLDRRYEDANGKWHSSASFSRNELPVAMHVMQKAYEFVLNYKATQNSGTAPVSEEQPV